MKKLVIDIETVGTPWEDHDPYVREFLLRGLSEGEAEEAKRSGGLSPFRGKIVAIGIVNIDEGLSCVLYEVPGQEELKKEVDGPRTYFSGNERQILETFWKFFENDSRFISFNGRQFDGPFLMIRSAINGVAPKRDLVGYRYGFHPNCDLRDALTFHGTVNTRQTRFNLDLACKAFGVQTPKAEGLDGKAVEGMYRAGRYREIARYCLEDVKATAELYEKLAPTLLLMNREFRDIEEREARLRRTAVPEQELLPIMPTSEAAFKQSVAETSMHLTAALEKLDVVPMAPAADVLGGKQQAVILEKLAALESSEEEIPLG